jgi:hypothetical protein
MTQALNRPLKRGNPNMTIPCVVSCLAQVQLVASRSGRAPVGTSVLSLVVLGRLTESVREGASQSPQFFIAARSMEYKDVPGMMIDTPVKGGTTG